MPDPPPLLRPERSAHTSIRGYLYQAHLGALRWLRLVEGEALLCEGDEDLDRYLLGRDQRVLEQVKDLSRDLELRVVKQTLRNFLLAYVHLRGNGEAARFVFTCTAELRPGSDGRGIMEDWRDREGVREAVRGWVVGAAGKGKERDEEERRAVSAALGWLDGEVDGWTGFLGAVEWNLGSERGEAVEQEIFTALAHRQQKLGLPQDRSLADALVVEVFSASSKPDPVDRVLRIEDLVALLQEGAARLDRLAPELSSYRERRDEAERVGKLLNPGTLDPHKVLKPGRVLPSVLLTARYEIVPFAGREAEIGQLLEWCEEDEDESVWLWHGQGGQGKSRLFLELCRRLRHQGWFAGFLDARFQDHELADLLDGTTPRLAVVDYAEARLARTQVLLERVATRSGGARIRIVLLARQAGPWWEELGEAGSQVQDLVLRSREPMALAPLVLEEADRGRELARAAKAYRPLVQEPAQEMAAADLSHPRFDRALLIHAAAFAALHGKRLETAEDLLSFALARERSLWRREVEELPNQPAAQQLLLKKGMEQAVAGLILTGGADDEAAARALLQRVLQPSLPDDLFEMLLALLGRLYSAPGAKFLEGLQPDLLGEQLVSEVLGKDSGLVVRVVNGASPLDLWQMLIVLVRMEQRTGDDRGIRALTAWIESEASEEAVMLMDALCTEEAWQTSVPLRELSSAATEMRLRYHRKRWPARNDEQRAKRARLLSNLGNRLSDLGRREEALEATQEAVDIYRDLARIRPDAFRPDFATSLNNLGAMLSDLGRREEALKATREAFDIRRGLARTRPDAFRPDLARSLSNLGAMLSDLDRREEALEVTREAVDLHRDLARTRPDAFRPGLAMSLNNLGMMLSGLGRREEALETTREAVDLYRDLTRTRPDAFRPDLALSLNNLGNAFSDLGRREEALDATREAVDIRRDLARTRPDAFRPDLALSLDNLGIRLSDLGRREEALETTREAVDIRRDLARTRPDAFRPDLARSLNNLSMILSGLGRGEETLAATGEAVALLLPFFERLPAAFANQMGNHLGNYLKRCQEAGQEPEAELVTRAQSIFQSLKAQAPVPRDS